MLVFAVSAAALCCLQLYDKFCVLGPAAIVSRSKGFWRRKPIVFFALGPPW